MASNRFGDQFSYTTWGESHGKAIGVIVDGCPPLLPLEELEINQALQLRKPGRNAFVSPRQEDDRVEILSGVYEGLTTGAPISLLIHNKSCDSSPYEKTKHLHKPGHASYTYYHKYGIYDGNGSGRASARETACRVAAGAIAEKILALEGIFILSYLQVIGSYSTSTKPYSKALKKRVEKSAFFCVDPNAEPQMDCILTKHRNEGNSIGGRVHTTTSSLPVGLGDPVYQKLEAELAYAMLSIPASKGFSIGNYSEETTGKQGNDTPCSGSNLPFSSNFSGGVLGGISNGMPLEFSVLFKATSSITHPQPTVDLYGNAATFTLPPRSKHDPCVAIRAVPVVKAMTAIVLVNALLRNQSSQLIKKTAKSLSQ